MLRSRYIHQVEKYSWILLLLAFLPGFLLNNTEISVAVSSLAVSLPILIYILCNFSVLAKLNQDKQVKLFSIFFLYSLASIAWNFQNVPVQGLVYKCFGIYLLLVLVFIVLTCREEKLKQIEQAFIGGGTLCLAAAMWNSGVDINQLDKIQGYGLFNNHVFVSWLAAVLCLILLARKSTLSIWECLLVCFYIYNIIFSRSRGGLIALLSGYLVMLFMQDRPFREKRLILCTVIMLVFSSLSNPYDLKNMLGKRYSARPQIWEKNLKQITQTAPGFVVGYGEGAPASAPSKKKALTPHYRNLYLGLLDQGGLVSLVLYLLFLAGVVFRGLKYLREGPWSYVTFGMSLSLIVEGDGFFVDPSPMMICFIIPLFITLFAAAAPQRQTA